MVVSPKIKKLLLVLPLVALTSISFAAQAHAGWHDGPRNHGYRHIPRRGYEVIVPPVPVIVQSTSPAVTVVADRQQEVFTVNIPDSKGSYTAVDIKRSGTGFIGPQGEFYLLNKGKRQHKGRVEFDDALLYTAAGPDELIKKIDDEDREHKVKAPAISVWDILGNFMYAFHPALITACVFFILSVGFLVNNKFVQSEPYMASLMDADNDVSLQSGDHVADGIETYFL